MRKRITALLLTGALTLGLLPATTLAAPAGEEMAHAAADAVGKEVLVWVYMDQFSKGGDQLKMRVLQHFEVIGTSEHPDAVAAAKKRAERLAARAA